MKGKNVSCILATCVLLTFGLAGYDHAHSKEHPEEKAKATTRPAVTKKALAQAIIAHIRTASAREGGFFKVRDEKKQEEFKLTLDKVHKDKLAKVGPQLYFVCADFKASNGKVYDLDFFMKGAAAEDLKVTEISVHKESGEERYTWHKKGGFWVKKSVGGASAEEHPKKQPSGEPPAEHPAEHPG